jgi:hypothetical protein
MNKLRKRIIFVLASFVTILLINASCTKANIDFGSQWLDNDYTKVVYVDTFTPALSTVYVDSFTTSGTGYGLAGVYKDPYFGLVYASQYAQFTPPTYSTALIDTFRNATFDSLTLVLKLKGNNYGDTTKNLTLNVYQLTENILSYSSSVAFYNTTNFAASTTPLGTKTFNFSHGSALTGDTVSIRLSDALGQELLAKLQAGSQDIQSTTQFLNYFRGIKISPDTLNPAFAFNFSDSVSLRLYYSSNGFPFSQKTYRTFDIYNSSYQFNHIDVNRSGTELGTQNLNRLNNNISSTLTDNKAFLQPITSSLAKITFPSIRNVLNMANFLQVTRATLTFQPESGTELPFYAIPPSLYLYTTDYLNGLGTALTYSSSVQTGSLYQDPTSSTYTYTYDITSYITGTELAGPNQNDRGLLIVPPTTNFKSRFDRLVIPDKTGVKGKIQIQLYYIAVK